MRRAIPPKQTPRHPGQYGVVVHPAGVAREPPGPGEPLNYPLPATYMHRRGAIYAIYAIAEAQRSGGYG